jgi:hypothetical protein
MLVFYSPRAKAENFAGKWPFKEMPAVWTTDRIRTNPLGQSDLADRLNPALPARHR